MPNPALKLTQGFRGAIGCAACTCVGFLRSLAQDRYVAYTAQPHDPITIRAAYAKAHGPGVAAVVTRSSTPPLAASVEAGQRPSLGAVRSFKRH